MLLFQEIGIFGDTGGRYWCAVGSRSTEIPPHHVPWRNNMVNPVTTHE